MGLCVGSTTDCQGAIAPFLVIFLVAAFQVCMRQHAGHASNQINIINKKRGRWSKQHTGHASNQINIIINRKKTVILNKEKGALEFGHRSVATVAGSGFDFGTDTLAGKSAEREIGSLPFETTGSCRRIGVRHDL